MKKALAFAALVAASPLLAAQPVDGKWLTEERNAVVTIGDCGKTVCGRISKFVVTPPQGLDQRDTKNKNPKLRDRKLLGMPILTGFTDDGDNWSGEIYDPKSGKTYRSTIRRVNANTLEVKGCIGPFCKTQTWTKAR